MGKYRHLTPEDREQVAVLRAAGWTNGAIAASIGRSPSTIGRELRRNSLESGRYSARAADGAYMARRQRDAILERDLGLGRFVRDRLADPLEVLEATVDFEYFRPWLIEGLGYGDGSKGGRPPFDAVSMFKALILQAQHNLSDARMEFMIRDRLSWMRFLGFDLGAPTPDENTIRHFRNRLTETGTLKRVMKAFDWQLQKKGYIPMAGQIVDASLVPLSSSVKCNIPLTRCDSGWLSRPRGMLPWESTVI